MKLLISVLDAREWRGPRSSWISPRDTAPDQDSVGPKTHSIYSRTYEIEDRGTSKRKTRQCMEEGEPQGYRTARRLLLWERTSCYHCGLPVLIAARLFSHAERIEFQKEISSSNFIPESSFTLVFISVSLFFFSLPLFSQTDLIYILDVLLYIFMLFTYIHVLSNGLLFSPESPQI
jgi:hypothetical protein